jgi:hypothetical protein
MSAKCLIINEKLGSVLMQTTECLVNGEFKPYKVADKNVSGTGNKFVKGLHVIFCVPWLFLRPASPSLLLIRY